MVVTLITIYSLVILLLAFPAIGRMKAEYHIPTRCFDERDIMFARARLEPGSPSYEAYYQMRPENKKGDHATR